MKQCIERKAIKEFSMNHKVYYTHFSVPFPFQNRDMIIDFRLTENKKENSVHISLQGRPGFILVRSGITRIQAVQGFWKIRQINEHQVHATYQMHLDPGGAIPAVVMNNLIKDRAFEMFEILSREVNKRNTR